MCCNKTDLSIYVGFMLSFDYKCLVFLFSLYWFLCNVFDQSSLLLSISMFGFVLKGDVSLFLMMFWSNVVWVWLNQRFPHQFCSVL